MGDGELQRDEYGDLFEDYGFLKRAEESKAFGNEAFSKERYEKAPERESLKLNGVMRPLCRTSTARFFHFIYFLH